MLFFNKKTFLKDLMPEDHVDFHSHILFGIDDGATTFEESLGLIKALKTIGIHHFITTPHIIQHVWENTSEIIINRKNDVNQLLEKEGINVTLKAAAEYLMDDQFVQLFKNKELLTLKENYVLVEMSYINAPIQLYDIIFDLQVAGYKPVLAHPERYTFYHNNFNEYQKLKNTGCLFQLNLLSTVGYYGPMVSKTADFLLKNNMFDYVGSDVHHEKHISFFDKKIIIKNHQNLTSLMQNNTFFDF